MSKMSQLPLRMASNKNRIGNWTNPMDACLVGLLVDQFQQGNCVKGVFQNSSWKTITATLNYRMAMTLEMSHCKNRWKVLKQTYHLYQELSNKTGWGWDDARKMAVPGDAQDWDRVISVCAVEDSLVLS
ncbi:hypothetical protein QJS04_geneDACA000814 [Acorus gramineus]|uniref:Myb/SANT-like domain-containing protein n=1 Tax=Acorus gramineus TaxID=55184 RepID=A0AAV9BG59_ACOGR|nr:hypothetical protein QJS04_geneDACA000814 [Acorus gramineus]